MDLPEAIALDFGAICYAAVSMAVFRKRLRNIDELESFGQETKGSISVVFKTPIPDEVMDIRYQFLLNSGEIKYGRLILYSKRIDHPEKYQSYPDAPILYLQRDPSINIPKELVRAKRTKDQENYEKKRTILVVLLVTFVALVCLLSLSR